VRNEGDIQDWRTVVLRRDRGAKGAVTLTASAEELKEGKETFKR